MQFSYFLPVNLHFGRGETDKIGSLTGTYAKRALVVTGSGSTKRSGLLDRVINSLAASGVEAIVFDRVQPNPLTTTAQEGAALAREAGCGAVVGLGGGSSMDCAKAIAFLCVNRGDLNNYIFGKETGTGALPLFLIPTTCGTGSEGNGFAVLTNPETGDKKSLRSNLIIPTASIVDSQLMETMPRQIFASVGFDALCHSMEAYLSKLSQPLSEYFSLAAIEALGENLLNIYRGSGTAQSWDAVTFASTLGGMAIHLAGVTLPHGMEHPASGLRDIVHGNGLAALTPVVTQSSQEWVPVKYGKIRDCLGSRYSSCADTLRHLIAALNLPCGLSAQGITEQDIPWMVENCYKVSSASIANHPVPYQPEDLAELYRLAM